MLLSSLAFCSFAFSSGVFSSGFYVSFILPNGTFFTFFNLAPPRIEDMRSARAPVTTGRAGGGGGGGGATLY